MDSITYQKFINWLLLRFEVYAPKESRGIVRFGKIQSSRDIEYSRKPFYPLRKLFLPGKEKLYSYYNKKYHSPDKEKKKRIVLGIPLFDLEALTYYSIIFSRDVYFQANLRNSIICGISPVPDENSFYQEFENKILHHLKFDLYFDQNQNNSYRLFSGSEEGQKILEGFGEERYEHIEYQGPLKDQGYSLYLQKIAKKIKASYGFPFWKKLGGECLACGKCTLVCPMCYCYDLKTEGSGKAFREWGNCFYSEFSEVAGEYKFLKNRTERIYNWYDHKFVRMPQEYGFVGCVQCGRCTEVCPVGINIKKNLEKIKKFK
ncbi:MAG: 4Fe-4S dicluster domain-containing protein [Candidatus Doudnabacteria bacterium]